MSTITHVKKDKPKQGVLLVLSNTLQLILYILQQTTKFVRDLLLVIWINRVLVVGLVILYLILWQANQGQDLLVNLNSRFKAEKGSGPYTVPINFIGTNLGPALFYLVLTMLAMLNWFLPKYFANRDPDKITWHNVFVENWNYGRNGSTLGRGNARILAHQVFISRMLGVITFIIPACAILNALDTFNIKYSFSPAFDNGREWDAHHVLGTLVLFFILLLYPFFDSRKSGTFCRGLSPQTGNNVLEETFEWLNKRRMTWVLLAAIVTLFGIVIGLGLRNMGHPSELFGLFLGLICVALAFAILVSIRRRLGCKRSGRLHRFWYSVKKHNLGAFILWSGLAFSTIFVLFNVVPFLIAVETLARTTTISIVLCGVVFYTMLFTLLILAGRKWRVNLAGGLLLFMFVAAVVWDNDFHDVETAPLTAQQERASLDDHIERWLKDRKSEIAAYNKSGRKYPVVLVNTHGGGIRAAAWTSMAIAHLDSVVSHKSTGSTVKDETFQRHVLSYSGASGGTVGASVLCALGSGLGVNYVVPSQTLIEFYQNDFLTPVVVALLGRDVLFSTFNIGGRSDRARLQTQLWERHLNKYVPGLYGQEYASLWSLPGGMTRTDIPLLFSNSYHLESGQKAIVAPVKLEEEDFVASKLVSELLASRRKSISLSTGAFLSARFPYVSPAGKLDSTHHFLDGGIRENSGAETSSEINAVLGRVIRRLKYDDHVEVVCLSLDNEGKGDPEQASKNVFELTAPAVGIYNVRSGNAAKAEALNRKLFSEKRYFQMTPVVEMIRLDNKGEFKPVLPLGWQMSYPALIRLQRSLKSKKMKEDLSPLLARFNPKPR